MVSQLQEQEAEVAQIQGYGILRFWFSLMLI